MFVFGNDAISISVWFRFHKEKENEILVLTARLIPCEG